MRDFSIVNPLFGSNRRKTCLWALPLETGYSSIRWDLATAFAAGGRTSFFSPEKTFVRVN